MENKVTLSERFHVGRFGEDAVRGVSWHDKNRRILPIFLEEEDIGAIQSALELVDYIASFMEESNI